MFYLKFLLLIVGVISLLNGCSKEIYNADNYVSPRQVSALSSQSMLLVNQPFHFHLTGDDLDVDSLRKAIGHSMSYYQKIPSQTSFYFGSISYTASELIRSLQLFLAVLEQETTYEGILRKLQSDFHLFASTANERDEGVLFTGYYEPIFKGNLTPTKEFNVPVYSLPTDLLVLNLGFFRNSLRNRTIVYRMVDTNVMPYYSRREIMEQKVLGGQNKEIAWMKDPVDLFFMQIQGSGILELPSGEKVKLSYNGSNGHNYYSIGKLLVDEGRMALEDVSMQSIRQYLNDHPESRDRILYHNESYTFFNLERDIDGPRGNINVPLTPHRSIAVDSTLFPKGALSYIASELPVFTKNWKEYSAESFARFVVVQDTGGAIKGTGRVDLFWGNGDLAENSAGMMRSFGKLYFLVAKKEAIAAVSSEQL